MSRVSWGMLFFLVTIILTGCSSDDDFSGRTFTIVDNSTLLETKEQMNMQEEDTRRVLLSLTFDSGEVTINSNQNLTGEYETFDDRLEITLSDDKGDVTLVFSDLASSVEKNVKYTAEISDIDYSLSDTGGLAQLEFMASDNTEGMMVSFEENTE
ncbi:hypothetical protein [Salinicoccus sp. YB14-2]|uniref:hypothetical protein n=1 Tax=Salinicoccus sp. YB14-2 TaxID=1572701 RepID=UPI00068F79C3|nr:hypothetical protein [Salinicoccus sp. YB14-2]